MLPWSGDLAGRIDELTIDSQLLRGNVLGDPHERPLWVYTPPGYDADDRRFPTVYVIMGYTGQVTMWGNRVAWRRPFPETADDAIASGQARPCVVVYVDAWTAYGGSQYVDSPGTGRYHSYLCDEVVPFVDERYRTIPDRRARAITGKSSGGFGAMITPMLRPDLFAHLATHSGDTLYELCYVPEFGESARALRDYDFDVFAWWGDFTSRPSFTKSADMPLITALGVSACFSADDDGTPVLPFDARSARLLPDVWQRWLAWDPVRMVEPYREALRSVESFWIDAGTRDEYSLDLGAEAFRAELQRIGVPDDRIAFELFDATHGGVDYRYPLALTWLSHRLQHDP
jgi:hypothetical protein